MDLKMIYTIGAMTRYDKLGEFNKAVDWRANFSELIQKNKYVDIFDPTTNYRKNLNYNRKSVVSQNTHYLNRSSIGVVNLEHLEYSPGSMYEIFRMHWGGKPVIAFGNNKIVNQPHINESITIRFDTLEEVVEYIENVFHLL